MSWDDEFDLVVVGSGGGGMAAALTAHDVGLSCVIVEKAKLYGGTTGISGGGIWVPNNPTLRRAGHDDSRESIRTYLDELIGERAEPKRLDAYVDHGPAAMALLEQSLGNRKSDKGKKSASAAPRRASAARKTARASGARRRRAA